MANILLADMDWEHLTLRATAREPKEAFVALQNEFYALVYDNTRTIGDFLQHNKDYKDRLYGMFLEYRSLSQNYLTDGTVEYVYNLPLKNLIMTQLRPKTRTIDLIVPMLCPYCGQDWPAGKQVPDNIQLVPKQIEPVEYSGIIIDCRNTDFSPCLFPRIVDTEGSIIYSIDYAHSNALIEKGLVQYTTTSPAGITRAGNSPFKVQALDARGKHKTDITISRADALRIHGSQNNIDLLKECRVVIIVNF